MQLSRKYQPHSLDDIIGQPPVIYLKQLAAEPYCKALLLIGSPGTGKTASAYALANDLGTHEDDVIMRSASKMGIDECKALWSGHLRYRPRNTGSLKVLIIDELEWLSEQSQRFLKTALEYEEFPPSTIVVATSNDTKGLSGPLLQRFTKYFFSGGPTFATAAVDKLHEIWAKECPGVKPPQSLPEWGWDGDSFSMRTALDMLQDHKAVGRMAVA